MSVQSEIDRIITAVGNAYSKVSEKGGTVPASQTVANLATAIDSIPSVGTKETWVIKSDASGAFATTQIAFTSNGQKYASIGAVYDGSGTYIILHYDNNEIAGFDAMGGGAGFEFYDEAYRTITFDTPPTGELLTWLQSNATKQTPDVSVQDTKAVTITSNGTVSVTPDASYDALKKVDVTVNVASGGGTCTLTTSVKKAPGAVHGSIYAYSGDALVTIASKGTYSINKNSLIYVAGAGSMDSHAGLSILYSNKTDRVYNVTSDIAEYKFAGT